MYLYMHILLYTYILYIKYTYIEMYFCFLFIGSFIMTIFYITIHIN